LTGILISEGAGSMEITRRDLLKTFAAIGAGLTVAGCSGTAVREGTSKEVKERVVGAIKARASNTPVIWLQGQSCAGCSVSLLNSVHPDIAEVLTQTINLEFHSNVMAAAGDKALSMFERAISNQRGEFVLVAEGSFPTGSGGNFCAIGERDGKPITSLEWVQRLGGAAKATLAVGACAAYGGIPAANGSPTGAKPFSGVIPNAAFINIPGCPAHPDWIVGTIGHVLLFGIPELDEYKRPKMFFSKTVHDNCERRSYFDSGIFAEDYSGEGCLIGLGCKGPESYCDAPIRGWNNHVNWCARSGGPCIGCTQPTFPDHHQGLYARLPQERIEELAGKPILFA